MNGTLKTKDGSTPMQRWLAGLMGGLLFLAPATTRAIDAPSGGRLWNVSDVAGLNRAVTELKQNAGTKTSSYADITDGGGTIVLAPGVYELTETLEFKGIQHVNLVGSGWNTILLRKGNGDALRLIDCSFAQVRNMKIIAENGTTSGSGVVLSGQGSSSCTIDKLRIRHFAQYGLFLSGTPEKPLSSNVVSNCHFIGNREVQLLSRHNHDFYFVGNQYGTHSENPKIGCWLDHSSAGSYTLNYHWDNEVGCKIGPGANFNRIENNRFEESLHEGIMLGEPGGDWSGYNIITGNTIHSNAKHNTGKFSAMVAFNASFVTFTNNQIFSWNPERDSTKHCLEVGAGCEKWIIKDNIMMHNVAKPALVAAPNVGHVIKDNMADLPAAK